MARPLKVGVQLPEVEYVASWADHLAMARVAEEIGLDSLWLGDHLLYRNPDEAAKGPWECWSMLAALAAVTTRVELGPLVACASFHNPAILAKQAATIDEISGGRLILGLGAGWNEVEYRAFGLPYDQRVSRFEEAFTIIRSLLRDGQVDFEGRYYQARDCELLPRGPRPSGPPLLIGSNGTRMLRITMPYAQAWNSWFTAFGNRPEDLAPLQQTVDEACRAVGRDPGEVERTAAVFVLLEGAAGARGLGDPDDRKNPPLSGSPKQLADAFRAFAAAGIGHLQLVLDPITPAGIEQLAPALELLDLSR